LEVKTVWVACLRRRKRRGLQLEQEEQNQELLDKSEDGEGER
jgi:hypothetical protein